MKLPCGGGAPWPSEESIYGDSRRIDGDKAFGSTSKAFLSRHVSRPGEIDIGRSLFGCLGFAGRAGLKGADSALGTLRTLMESRKVELM